MKDFYSKKYNARFLNCPKNGSTCIRKTLNCFWHDIDSIPDDCINFTVLREPLDRFSSQFSEVILKGRSDARCLSAKKHREIISWIRSAKNQEDKILRFIDSISDNGCYNKHLISQKECIMNTRGRNKIQESEIIFLNFKKFPKQINNLLNTNIKFKVHNKGRKRSFDLFLKHRCKIENLYENDFIMYNDKSEEVKW